MVSRTGKVLFLAVEAAPFVKTGGLADVIGALPAALGRLGWDVRVCLPFFRRQWHPGGPAAVECRRQRFSFAGRTLDARLLRQVYGGVTWYLLDQPELFAREHLYGPPGGDYPDNPSRFGFFCRAALELTARTGFLPALVHAHDWHAAPAPVYLKHPPAGARFPSGCKSVLTVHNLSYQGIFDRAALAALDLPGELFHPGALEYFGRVNLLKGGLVFADRLTTVSPTYSREIMSPEYGCGLDGVLRERAADLSGITNGLDRRAWNPANDRLLAARFSSGRPAGRSLNKSSLCAAFALEPERPLAFMVSRLVPAKGIELVRQSLPGLLAAGGNLFLLGTGLPEYESFFLEQARRCPGRFAFHRGFSEKLAHRLYAAGDLLLMPSLFEPCGISQLIAMRYGAVPLARRTGGLADTISDHDGSAGNGFLFSEATPGAFLACLDRALAVYRRPAAWERLVRNALAADFSWSVPARRYQALYRALVTPATLSGKAEKTGE